MAAVDLSFTFRLAGTSNRQGREVSLGQLDALANHGVETKVCCAGRRRCDQRGKAPGIGPVAADHPIHPDHPITGGKVVSRRHSFLGDFPCPRTSNGRFDRGRTGVPSLKRRYNPAASPESQ